MTERVRCAWAGSAPEYVAYHDDEWGRPLHGVAALFERLSLEAFQSGLSWLVILRKRPAFRAAFAGFDPAAVAMFGPADVDRLVGRRAGGEGGGLGAVADAGTFEEFKHAAERAFLLAKLRQHDWNVSETARALEMPRSNVYKKIERYGLKREEA